MNSKTEHIVANISHRKIEESKALIVVDKYISSIALKNMLNAWGYNVVGICTSNQDVLNRLKKDQPDFILTDMELNGCNGIHLRKQSDTQPCDSNLSIYFTTYSTDLTIQRAINAASSMGFGIDKSTNNYYKDFESSFCAHHGIDLMADHIKQSLQKKPIRILLVDDQQIILWGLKKFFENEKPRIEIVGSASNLVDAKKIASDTIPDIVILNIYIDNADCINTIPEFTNHANSRVVIFTETNDKEIIDRAVLSGARGVVNRKESMQTILRAIEKIYDGELWLDRITTGRIFLQNSRMRGKKFQHPEEDKITTLTRKECIILKAFADGMGGEQNKQIAAKLCMSEHTLRNHLTSIFSKLGIKNRFSLFAYAKQYFKEIDTYHPVNDTYEG